jgi:hypothetical protein
MLNIYASNMDVYRMNNSHSCQNIRVVWACRMEVIIIIINIRDWTF